MVKTLFPNFSPNDFKSREYNVIMEDSPNGGLPKIIPIENVSIPQVLGIVAILGLGIFVLSKKLKDLL